MTVIELIQLLQECDPNKEVTMYDYGLGFVLQWAKDGLKRT